ncbi:hypothetical protein D3C73_1471330 [compost metagenome]
MGLESSTTITELKSHPPETTRWAVPMSFMLWAGKSGSSPWTLNSPGQYSPGISPTAAWTPTLRSAPARSSPNSAKRALARTIASGCGSI